MRDHPCGCPSGIEREGWKLADVGYVFEQTGSVSRDEFYSSVATCLEVPAAGLPQALRHPSGPSHQTLQLATTDPSCFVLTLTSVEPPGPVPKLATPVPGFPTVAPDRSPRTTQTM
jgi:hypothetical protein